MFSASIARVGLEAAHKLIPGWYPLHSYYYFY